MKLFKRRRQPQPYPIVGRFLQFDIHVDRNENNDNERV